jgi:Ni/Co efflux regulator RcnB
MKKLAILALGLSLSIGTTIALAQNSGSTDTTKKKHKKGKKSDTTDTTKK